MNESVGLSMIFSKNRFPLFRTMLQCVFCSQNKCHVLVEYACYEKRIVDSRLRPSSLARARRVASWCVDWRRQPTAPPLRNARRGSGRRRRLSPRPSQHRRSFAVGAVRFRRLGRPGDRDRSDRCSLCQSRPVGERPAGDGLHQHPHAALAPTTDPNSTGNRQPCISRRRHSSNRAIRVIALHGLGSTGRPRND